MALESRETRVGPMQGSLESSGLEARISIAKHVRSGGWPSQEMFELRAVLPSSMQEPRRFTPPTRTYAVAIASALIFGQHPMTSGLSGTTGPLVFPTRGLFPPAIIAHALYYYTLPDALVVDPMAGGGTTLDVCQSMGRRCLAYDLQPTRPEISSHDIRHGFPAEAAGCDLIFCDPPYHTMLARQYSSDSIASAPFSEWITFLHDFARDAFATLAPGGYFALLLAAQTEKDLPAWIWLSRSRVFWLFSRSARGFLTRAPYQLSDGGSVHASARTPSPSGRTLTWASSRSLGLAQTISNQGDQSAEYSEYARACDCESARIAHRYLRDWREDQSIDAFDGYRSEVASIYQLVFQGSPHASS